MNLAEIDFNDYKKRIKHDGITLKISVFNVKIKTNIDVVINNFYYLYQEFTLITDNDFIDFDIELKKPNNLRGIYRPQVNFYMDGHRPFKPLPLDQSMAFFEWGLNWAIAQYAHQYYIIHSAVVERNNRAIIMPGVPGAGKSTLCAALVHHGWRLLSDEQALVSLDAKTVTPISRPINLKNESIDVIKKYCPNSQFGDLFLDTNKGDISHVKPPTSSVNKMFELAKPYAIVFPKFNRSAVATKMQSTEKGIALIQLIDHSFNYDTLAKQGFQTATKLVEQCQVFDFQYHHLDEALIAFEKLVNQS